MSEEFKKKLIENCAGCKKKDIRPGYCVEKCTFGYEIYWGMMGLLRHLRGDPKF